LSDSSLAVITQASKLLQRANTVQQTRELKSMFLVAAEWAKRMKMGAEA